MQRQPAHQLNRRIQLAWAALALSQRGPLLATDPYAPWAEQVREATAAHAVELESTVLAETRHRPA